MISTETVNRLIGTFDPFADPRGNVCKFSGFTNATTRIAVHVVDIEISSSFYIIHNSADVYYWLAAN